MKDSYKRLPHPEVIKGGIRIEYDQKVRDRPNHTIIVNPELLTSALQLAGVTDEVFKKIKLTVKSGKHNAFFGAASMNKVTNNISIYPEIFLSMYEEALQTRDDILAKNRPPSPNDFEELLTTKRLSEYLTHTDSKRTTEFSNNLLLAASEKKLSKSSLHESKHASENAQQRLMNLLFGAVPAAVGSTAVMVGIDKAVESLLGVSLYENQPVLTLLSQATLVWLINAYTHDLNPYEKRAFKFSSKMLAETKYHSLIKIVSQPKPSPSLF